MVFEQIQRLKQQWTDKWVVADSSQPEFRRFSGCTGRVRTVNMSGLALVEFDQYANIGWYDIDPRFLKIVDQPPPQKPTAKPTAKPAAKPAKADPATSQQKAAQPAKKSEESGMSVADILAAARGGKSAAPAEAKPVAAKQPAPDTKPVPAAGGTSVADILAAAKQQGAAGSSAPASAAQIEESTGESAAPAEVAIEPEAEPAAPEVQSSGPLPTDVDSIVELCRQRDGQ